MSNTYQFLKKLIVRTPSLPFNDDISEAFLKNLMSLPSFSEALYLASPVLYHEAQLWKDDKINDLKKVQKITFSIAKYYSRMCSRCTPFGMFAGCAVVDWDKETDLVISPEVQRNTRLDMHYLGALAQHLSEIPVIKSRLQYFPNSSIYQIGTEIRYVEHKYINGRRTHQISAFECSEYIALVLDTCKEGAMIQEMILQLIDDDISAEEAQDFIEQLIEAQLLINELEPAITNDSFIKEVLCVLDKVKEDESYKSLVEDIIQKLQTIDAQEINNISAYQQIIEIIKQFGIPFEEGKLFQTDLVKVFDNNSLSIDYQQQLQEVVDLMIELSEATPNKNQQHFIKQFYDRYENQEIPLLIALDMETGIGYGETGRKNNTTLAEGFTLPQPENQDIHLKLSPFQQFLFQEWLKAYKAEDYEVKLNEEVLLKFKQKNIKTPTSISLSFRMTGDESLPIYLENIGGSNAVSALGRFAHADKNVKQLIQEITQKEQALNPEVIFAEVIHLPENRIGNILLHPAFWSYEIPYLAKSSLPLNNQITLDDLLVSVDLSTNRIILHSKKLKKEIIPRLSNAHNYSTDTLPVYHFLCDLQNQGLHSNFRFSWETIAPKLTFSPRLSYKNIILQSATWLLNKEDFSELLEVQPTDILTKTKLFRAKWKLPKRFVLADFDNELLVNSENLLSVQTWLDCIKKRDKIELKELLFHPESSFIKNREGKGFSNQFIASLLHKKTVYHGKTFQEKPAISTQRHFSLGSEWLYLKFYSGTKSADDILGQSIKPVLEQLLQAKLIDKWFFIRYADPDKHIRLRLHLVTIEHIAQIILALKESIEPFEQNGIIWKTQFDTYQREIERYDIEVIEQVEEIFFYDSYVVINMLEQTWGDEREHIRWQFTIQLIDTYLNDFSITLKQKLHLMKHLKDSFAQEFHVDKSLKLQIDKRFRENRKTIERVLEKSTDEHQIFSEVLAAKSELTQKCIHTIKIHKKEEALFKFLSDTIHLSVNRSISDNQRFHELLIYDFMYRYYQAEMAKNKTSKSDRFS